MKAAPKLGDHAAPDAIQATTSEIQRQIQTRRSGAQPGDVFTPAIRELLATIHDETDRRDHKDARRAVLGDGNPADEGIKVPLRVNHPYPPEAPLSMVPPALLERLPHLPDGLQYRFVGKSLILYDADADLVVDFVQKAVK